MKVIANIKNGFHENQISLTTNDDSKTLTIPSKPTGYGSSINGAELLLLSLATCYCNDIYREAAKRNIEVFEVIIDCRGDFGAPGEPGYNFRYKPIVKSNATEDKLLELIEHTDKVAEIHKTLRQGLDIELLK